MLVSDHFVSIFSLCGVPRFFEASLSEIPPHRPSCNSGQLQRPQTPEGDGVGIKTKNAQTPPHTHLRFWLNQTEIWFSIFTREVIRGGTWQSKQEVVRQNMQYIKRYNEITAAPFNWIYTGKPLVA
jgi:hypothetical protein